MGDRGGLPVPAVGAFPAAAAAAIDGDGVAAAAAAELRGVLGCDALCGLGLLATGGRPADAAAACCCWRAAEEESLLLLCSLLLLLLLLPKGKKKGAPLGLAPRLLLLPARGEAQTPAAARQQKARVDALSVMWRDATHSRVRGSCVE
jgi:hypothetical protein